MQMREFSRGTLHFSRVPRQGEDTRSIPCAGEKRLLEIRATTTQVNALWPEETECPVLMHPIRISLFQFYFRLFWISALCFDSILLLVRFFPTRNCIPFHRDTFNCAIVTLIQAIFPLRVRNRLRVINSRDNASQGTLGERIVHRIPRRVIRRERVRIREAARISRD